MKHEESPCGLSSEKGLAMDREKKTLYVRMFGGFSMYYGKEAVALNRVRNSKSVRLLQMLLLSAPNGISKSELIDYLYKWNEDTGTVDYNNTLNVLVHRLKKQLTTAGLPEDNYIGIQDGICRFQSKVPLEIDVWQFENAVEEAGKVSGGGKQREVIIESE